MGTMSEIGGRVRERLVDDLVRDNEGCVVDPGEALVMEHGVDVPTMLVERELNYLHWLGAQQTGAGRVVELGCFLGGSTAAIVEGMRRTGVEHQPVLVYDAFIAPESEAVINSWWMTPFGLNAGENFRKKYEQLHRSRLDRIYIREGWLPPAVDRAGEREVYPEQDPIELLFIDAAKSWDVHSTIMRALGRHVGVGGVVVQQDFVDIGTPWLAVHMWQLRDVFEPLDAVRGTPSISFRCIGDPSSRVDEVWGVDALRDSVHREEVWAEVMQYWGGLLGTSAAGFLHGHAAMHAAYYGDRAGILIHARAYEAWASSVESRDVYVTPTWDHALERLAVRVGGREGRALRTESRVRRSMMRQRDLVYQQGFVAPEVRRRVWGGLCARVLGEGHTKIALYGAGKHTRWLLKNVFPESGLDVACVIDDAPSCDSIGGVRVVSPQDASRLMEGVRVVVVSSDVYEEKLLERAEYFVAAREGMEAMGVYAGISHDRGDVPVQSLKSREEIRLADLDPAMVRAVAPERSQLGLEELRGWCGIFASRYKTPAWVSGYVNSRDALLLWDVLEAVRPECVVEIGTASGMSTSALVAGALHFARPGTSPIVHSFDIAPRCYFDETRLVGAAVAEVTPDLVGHVHLYPGMTAVDAANNFRVREVDFVFIDGDHRHPAPTMDLLALLYALKPGAWVVLHDIELPAICEMFPERERDWDVVCGAEILFKRWPFEKLQPTYPDPTMNNIGAVRMPEDPGRVGEVAAFLLELLNEPWETPEGSLVEVKQAVMAMRA